MATTSQVIAQTFKAAGTQFAFGIPGGAGSSDMIVALDEAGIQFVLTNSEGSAAMMAAATGELTGAPGVAIATIGPGAAAMVHGIAYAHLDRAPMVALTDRYSEKIREVAYRQRFDHNQLFAPITKYTGNVNAGTAASLAVRAVRLSTAYRQGPVHLDIPSDQTREEAGTAHTLAPVYDEQVPNAVALETIVDRMKQAKRPAVIAGVGVMRQRAWDPLVRLAEAWGIPVLTSPKAKGAIPESHPYSGWAFTGGVVERRLLDRADLILTVGMDAVELIPGHWPLSQPTIHIDALPNIDANYIAEIELVAAIGASLDGLADLAPSGSKWDPKEIANYRIEAEAAMDVPSKFGIAPQRVFKRIAEILPESAICLTDSGANKVIANLLWHPQQPLTFLTSFGLSTMGFSLPGAIAAKLIHPDRVVVSYTGDGGLLMKLNELEVAARLGLPVISVCFNDRSLFLIKVKQEAKGYRPTGVDFNDTDFVRVAEGFGCAGRRVDREEDIVPAMEWAMAQKVPTVLDVRIDPEPYVKQMEILRG